MKRQCIAMGDKRESLDNKELNCKETLRKEVAGVICDADTIANQFHSLI